jgi:hypothetical protein
MSDIAHARSFALTLPGTTEQPHHDMSSFRVAGKIFATVTPDETRLHVFVDEPEIAPTVAENPAAFEPLYWGKSLRGIRVLLAAAPDDRIRELLTEAWLRRAPASLAAERTTGRAAGASSRPPG